MARYYENTTTFNFSWEQVACGYWKRYPNPQSTHVLSEDTWSRQVKDGCLHTKRLLTKTNKIPKWGERFFNAKSVKIVEESIVDPQNKVLVTYTRNLGFAKIMNVVERVEYRSLGPAQTVARRSAWVDSQVYGFSRAIRAFGLDRFRKNANQMVMGFNYVLHNLYSRPGAGGGGSVGGAGSTLKDMRLAAADAAAAAATRAKANVLSSVQRT